MHAINTRVLRVQGFSPAESRLLLGFNPNRTGWDVNPNTECAVAALSTLVASGTNKWKGEGEEEEEEARLADQQLERLARIDDIRQQAASEVVDEAQRCEERQRPMRHAPPKDGDLVLLRRFLLDQRRGSKLEPRWEGPYVLSDLAWHGKSGRLRDFNTGEVVRVKKGALRDRIHLNDLKVYLQRRIEAEVGVTIVDILEYEKRVMIDLGKLEDVFGFEKTEARGRRSVE